jgi:hypothetical protein
MTISSILGLIFIIGLVAIAIRKLSQIDSKTVNQSTRKSYVPTRKDYANDSKGSDE